MELRALISCLVVFGLGIPTHSDAEQNDIIPGGYPGRYIGTPLVKKNGKEYVQFQDCSVIKNAKIREAECRAIVEVPSDVLINYLKCTRADLELEKNLWLGGAVVGGAATAALLAWSGPGAGVAFAVYGGSLLKSITIEDELKSLNHSMREIELTNGIDYKIIYGVDALVNRITALYTDIIASGCFTGEKLGKVKASINLYGNRGPKKKVALDKQKFYLITGGTGQTSGSENNKQTGGSLIKDSTQGEAR